MYIFILKIQFFRHGQVENIIFNTRADFKVLMCFKIEYAIKNFFQKVNGLPPFFLNILRKKIKNTPLPLWLNVKVKFFIPPVILKRKFQKNSKVSRTRPKLSNTIKKIKKRRVK